MTIVYDRNRLSAKESKLGNVEDEKATSKSGWLTQIGHMRDALLVVAGATYILGYITWSFHAWMNGLGMLPALEAQYFVAGFIPVVIVISVIIALRGSMWLRGWYCEWILSDKTNRRLKIARYICFSLTVVFVVIVNVVLYLLPHLLHTRFLFFLLLFLIIYYLFFPPMKRTLQKESRLDVFDMLISKVGIFVYIVYLGSLASVLYINAFYPNIPQEFGGVRPRCAYLDIVLDQTSTETLQGIAPSDALNVSSQVIRSNIVDVYFSGRDVILVKPHGLKGRDTPTYEIKQSIVKAVTWCSENTTNEELPDSQK